MTTDLTRALDPVDPPDRWDDIVRRSTSDGEDAPIPLDAHGGRARRLLAVAAVVLVVAAIAGALALRGDDDGHGPAGIWGHRWRLVRIQVGDAVIDKELLSPSGAPIVLDAAQEGRLRYQVCNRTEGPARLEGDRLRLGPMVQTSMGCSDPLDQLVRLDGARVEATDDVLVLTTGGEHGGPTFRYDLVPATPIAIEDQVRDRRWRVTQVRAAGAASPTQLPPGEGPVVDLRDRSQVIVEACGPETKPGRVVGDQLQVEPGRWQTLMIDCRATPGVELLPTIEQILDAGATVARDQHRLVVTSRAGSFEAETASRSWPWDLFADPYAPSTARWRVVEALDHDRPRDLLASPTLTVTSHPEAPERTIDLSGCGSFGGEVTDIDERAGAITYRPDKGGVAMGCSAAEAAQAAWIEGVLAGQPTVDALSGRARISVPGRSITLVRVS